MDELYNDMDTLIAKFLAGEASPEETIALYDWMEQSPENRKSMEAAEVAWALGKVDYQKPDSKEAYKVFKHSKPSRSLIFTPLRIAASVLILLCFGTIFYFTFRTPVREEIEWITKESNNKSLVWQLPEKTSVTLKDNSQLRYPKTFESSRSVTLTGEAYFSVTPDSLKPFIISTTEIEVRVVGTAFNVSAYPTDSMVSVQVVHGKVIMKHDMDSLFLMANQKGLYNKHSKKLWLETTQTHNNVGYATHTFTYTDNSLGEILDDLSKAYSVSIELENIQVRNCRLTGEYHSMSLPVILEVISKSLDLTYRISGNQVYISGDGCL